MSAQSLEFIINQVMGSKIARGALISVGVRIYGAAAAYLTQLYLARSIGAEQLGIYVFAWTWMSVLAFLTPLGFDTSVVRYIPTYMSQDKWNNLKGVIRTSRQATIVTSIIVAIFGCWLVNWNAWDESPYQSVLIVAFISVPILALINLHEGIARGFTWIWQVSLPNYGIRSSLFLLFAIIFIGLFHLAFAEAMVTAMVLACIITLIIQIKYYHRLLPAVLQHLKPVYEFRNWTRNSLPMMLVVSFELMLANTDIIMIGSLKGPADTGVYNIAVRTAGVLLFIFFAISSFSAAKIAELNIQKDTERLLAFSRKVRYWTSVPTLFGVVLLVSIGQFLFGLLGEDFAEAYIPMNILCIGIALRSLAGPVDNLLVMTGKQDQVAVALAAVMVLNVIANWLLIPPFGVQGAAIATASSVVLELLIMSIMASRHIGYKIFLFKI